MSDTPDAPRGGLLMYTSAAGKVKVEVAYENESCWLTQKKMADLFAVDVRTINWHLGNIFKTRELDRDSVIQESWITAADGKRYLTNLYNLEAIISVAEGHYEAFRVTQDLGFESDFEKETRALTSPPPPDPGKPRQ